MLSKEHFGKCWLMKLPAFSLPMFKRRPQKFKFVELFPYILFVVLLVVLLIFIIQVYL